VGGSTTGWKRVVRGNPDLKPKTGCGTFPSRSSVEGGRRMAPDVKVYLPALGSVAPRP
jgi:hypothetical protein